MENSVKDRILAYIKAKDLSQKRFEQSANLSNGYVSNLRHAPSAEKLSSILSAFPDLNRTWLLTGEGTMLNDASHPPSPEGTPIYDVDATCGFEIRDFTEEHIVGYVSMPSIRHDAIIITARGDSMQPVIKDGDHVVLHEVKNWDFVVYGQIYLIVTEDYRLIKYVRKGDDSEHVTLRSENSKYEDFQMPLSAIRKLFIVENVLSIRNLI